MLAAGPADDEFNVLLDKEVLQQLALFGTPADGDAAAAAGAAPQLRSPATVPCVCAWERRLRIACCGAPQRPPPNPPLP